MVKYDKVKKKMSILKTIFSNSLGLLLIVPNRKVLLEVYLVVVRENRCE